MSIALLYSLVRFLLDALLSRRQSELRLRAEVLALRHQLRVLELQVAALAGSPPTALEQALHFGILARGRDHCAALAGADAPWSAGALEILEASQTTIPEATTPLADGRAAAAQLAGDCT